jgi:hypothetical protein
LSNEMVVTSPVKETRNFARKPEPPPPVARI